MDTSTTTQPELRRRFKWYHLYYFLAAFDVLTISASLYLNHTVLEIYSDSVDGNAVWSNRVSQYSRLNELAAGVNAPGNDAFDSGDIVTERARLATAYLEFQNAASNAREDLQRNGNIEESSVLLQQLDDIDIQVIQIQTEATSVFSELENNRQEAAGSRMAEMDRCFSRSLGLIGALCESVRKIQSTRFAIETARAQRLGRYEFCIVAVVCVILCVVTWYGHKMADYMRRSEEQIRVREGELVEANRTANRLAAFGQILDRSVNEIYIFDIESLHFVHVNEGARKNIGYTMAELRVLTPIDIKPEHTAESFAEMVAPLLEGSTSNLEFTTVHRRQDGSEYPVQVQLERAQLGDQPVVAATLLDITARQQLETDLRDSRERALSASHAKGEFLANMSHEIRTPMTAILGFTDLLLDNVVQPENIDAARTVKENGDYLLNVINDVLDLSKIESGKLDIERIASSPQQIVANVTSLMKVRAKAKGLPLNVRFGGPVPETIVSDPTRLRQILINLVGNAIKFTETGSVTIVTRLLDASGEAPRLQFDVVDTGIGIAAGGIEKLFLAFTQADNSTTRQFGGTGLGLTISKRLAEALGGGISASSAVGEGSTFSVTIPVGSLDGVKHLQPVSEVGGHAVSDTESGNKAASLDNCRILLAEDGPDNQRLIGFVLRKAGADVTIAHNGQIGLELATTARADGRPFDVILMDMQMPVLDGYAATRRLRDDGYTLPIIALTAHAMATDRQKCLDAGCDDYTTKPINRAGLIELLASYTKPSQTVVADAST